MSLLSDLYGACDSGFVTIWTLPDKVTKFFPVTQINEAEEYALRRASDSDVYFGVGLRKAVLPKGRGGIEEVGVLTALFADIDIADAAAHKSTELPKTAEEALDFLKVDLPIAPSVVINSGNGLHVYWLLDEPLYITNDEEKDSAQALLAGWNRYVNVRAKGRGWKFDSVGELSRVLRVPQTYNRKKVPFQKVESLFSDCVGGNSPSAFDEYIIGDADDGLSQSDRDLLAGGYHNGGEKFEMPSTIPDGERNNTLFKFAASLRARGLDEDSILTLTQKENMKRCSPPLPEDELRTIVGSAGRYQSGTSPAALALKAEETLQPALDGELSSEDIVRDEVFDALFAIQDEVRRHMLYQKLLARARQLRVAKSFEGLYKARNATEQAERRRQDALEKTESGLDLRLPDLPVQGFVSPNEWEVNETGVRRVKMVKGMPMVDVACPHPIIVAANYMNVETGDCKTRLAYRIDGKWRERVTAMSTISSRQSIVRLSDSGIRVTSETAKNLVQYLEDFAVANIEKLKAVESIGRLGWFGKEQFIPYNTDIVFDGDENFKAMFEAVCAAGSKEKWLAAAREARKDFVGRLALAASFASPLMHHIGENIFIVHLWGRSGTGKTVALLLAESIWGNPKKLIKTFNSTTVGLERVAAFYHSLPLCLDEFQTLNTRFGDATQLLYHLTEGKGKSRGTREGGVDYENVWSNVIMTNGEQPLTDDKTDDGARNRSVEVYVREVLFGGRLAAMCDVISENYGHAGMAFIEGIIEGQKHNPNAVKEATRMLRNALASVDATEGAEVHTDKQLNALSTLGAADLFSSQYVFGESTEVAQVGTQAFVKEALHYFKSAAQIDKVAYGYETVMGWLSANSVQFNANTARSGEVLGVRDSEDGRSLVYVIKSVLDDELYRHGLSPAQMAQGWRERGWLTKTDAKHNTVKKVVGGNRVRCYVFQMDEGIDEDFIPVDDEMPAFTDADVPPENKQRHFEY
jgi:uncharacterized protein (DUF927 family)